MKQNLIDRAIAQVAPGYAVKRMVSRAQLEILNSLEPLRTNKRSQSPITTNTATDEKLINTTDRQNMHKIVRTMCKENPVLDGMVDRMVNNIIPPDGIHPNAISDDKTWNQNCEDYYATRSEFPEITGRMSMADYQRTLLRCYLKDGDFLNIFTNARKTQGIEAHRCATPLKLSGHEDADIHQGVRIDSNGAPISFYVTKIDRYGNLSQSDFVEIPAAYVEHSFVFDRFDQWRGITCFLPALDNLRDMMDILTYEKFAIKIGAAMGLKLKPPTPGQGNSTLPFPGTETTNTETGRKQVLSEMYPGMILNLQDMGVSDAEIMENKRPSANFASIIEMLSRLAGLGCSLPIELVLLDFTKGNMASARAALMEARKVFYENYYVVKKFCRRHYIWTIEQGILDGELKPPSSIAKPFQYLKHDWTEPVYNYLDPLNELEADAMAIAYGFQTFDDVAKRRGKDWAAMVKKLSTQWKLIRDANIPVVVGQPGNKTVQDMDDEQANRLKKKAQQKKSKGDSENE